jgi:hypothetical protein
LPNKWNSASVVIPAFRRCLPNRCLAMVAFITILIWAFCYKLVECWSFSNISANIVFIIIWANEILW